MDIALIMFALYVLGLASGVLIGRSWVMEKIEDQNESGVYPK